MKIQSKCNRCSEQDFNPASNDWLNALKRRSNENKVLTTAVVVSFPYLAIIEGRFEIQASALIEMNQEEINDAFEKYAREVSNNIIQYDKFKEYINKHRAYPWLKY